MSDIPIDERARQLADVAIDTLEDVMRDGIKDSDRIKAAEAILDRGFGKAAQAIVQVPGTQRQQALLAAMTDEQLVAIIEQKPLPKALPSQPMVDVVQMLEAHPLIGSVTIEPQRTPRRLKGRDPKDPAIDIYKDEIPEHHPLMV